MKYSDGLLRSIDKVLLSNKSLLEDIAQFRDRFDRDSAKSISTTESLSNLDVMIKAELKAYDILIRSMSCDSMEDRVAVYGVISNLILLLNLKIEDMDNG